MPDTTSLAPEAKVLKQYEALGFKAAGMSGAEYYGDCVFCGKHNKFYLNPTLDGGRFSCKSGACSKAGNLHIFMRYWYEMMVEDEPPDAPWDALVTNRMMPKELLQSSGIAYDHVKDRWVIPIRNKSGNVVNFRFYRIGSKCMGMPHIEVGLHGYERLNDDTKRVWLCEGEWDAICLNAILEGFDAEGDVALGIPGAGIFKDVWCHLFQDKAVAVAFDNDEGGAKGAIRTARKLLDCAASVQVLDWGEAATDGCDIRDFYSQGGDLEGLTELLVPFGKASGESKEKSEPVTAPDTQLALPLGEKPSFQELTEAYKRWLFMDQAMEDGLRVIYAVALSVYLPGDPLWMHIVSPPGGGKTEMLVSLAGSMGVHLESSLTAHSLISGFKTPDKKDPSIIPKLNGKCFVLKDFTEIIDMNRQARDEVYGMLRGAYDGKVERSFGNGVHRSYECNFAMLSGVTPVVFAERSANLGERFLIYHIQKGVGFDSTQAVMAALSNAGEESPMRAELQQLARDYLDHPVDIETVPVMSYDYMCQLNALAHLVAMLRGSVLRDIKEDKLLFRPQHEVPTRIAKQLKRLTETLAMLEEPAEINERVYNIVCRVAFDTCVGFNLDVLRIIALGENASVKKIGDATGIPYTTLKSRLEDMVLLGALTEERVPNESGRGAPGSVFNLSDHVKKYWVEANLSGENLHAYEKSPIPEGIKRRR